MLWLLSLAAVLVGTAADVEPEPQRQFRFDAGARACDWEIGGSATFVNHALRLTPDKQSRKGHLWSKHPLATVGHEWVVEMEFRVFGQGVTLFGDGLALWITKDTFRSGNGE